MFSFWKSTNFLGVLYHSIIVIFTQDWTSKKRNSMPTILGKNEYPNFFGFSTSILFAEMLMFAQTRTLAATHIDYKLKLKLFKLRKNYKNFEKSRNFF